MKSSPTSILPYPSRVASMSAPLSSQLLPTGDRALPAIHAAVSIVCAGDVLGWNLNSLQVGASA
jgi:hypothetical protein